MNKLASLREMPTDTIFDSEKVMLLIKYLQSRETWMRMSERKKEMDMLESN